MGDTELFEGDDSYFSYPLDQIFVAYTVDFNLVCVALFVLIDYSWQSWLLGLNFYLNTFDSIN